MAAARKKATRAIAGAPETVAVPRVGRRGIIAAAAALVAGLATQRVSQPVAATSGTGTDGNFVLGSNDTNNTANYASARTQLVSGLTFRGPALLDVSSSPFQSSGDANAVGVAGMSRGTAAGVFGADYNGAKPSGYPAGMNAGVYGYTYTQGHSGVRGDGGSYGIGVSGVSFNANAVLGTTLSSTYNGNAAILGLGYGIAVQGTVPADTTKTGTMAVYGNNGSPASSSGIGVYGQAAQFGVVGLATANGGYGVYGLATVDGSAGFAGGTSNPNAYAAVFGGRVVVNGPFTVTGAKSAAVPHPDGSRRLVYCVEAPESWLEDFGTGKIVAGRAEVRFDPDFAALIDPKEVHIFVTEYDGNNALYVPQRSATGFTAQADAGAVAARGRRMQDVTGTFSYRVVARRKDIPANRLAKVTIPEVKIASLPPQPPSPPPHPVEKP